MERTYIEKQVFEKKDFTVEPLPNAEYESCTFSQCNFSNTDLSRFNFTECAFITCNLSLAKLGKTSLKDVKFKDCKLLGLHFHNCNEFMFAVGFENCVLKLSSFYKLKLKNTVFKNCDLEEADFTESDLSSALFDNCNLSGTRFENTLLEKADLRTAINYTIDPELNKLKKARFSQTGLAGLLQKYQIEIE